MLESFYMIRTRFAPSPTGSLHIGSLRTALFAYAYAKHFSGQFILRIEDTDRKREVAGAIEGIQNILNTFAITWDEFYIQSKRKETGIYQAAAEKLVSSGHAFYCQCTPKNAKEEGFSSSLRDPCREKKLTTGGIKLKVPDGQRISYFDIVRQKEISWATDTVYDATLLKSDGFPTYHLAAVYDDLDMKISHIFRGHDWLPSTPIHLLVFQFLGGKPPQIGHLTDILSPLGGKLSKRRDSVFVEQFLKDGYLPEAILNFIMLLGWAPKDNREMFSLLEFIDVFTPDGLQASNPLFVKDKLDWLNGHYIRQKSDMELSVLVQNFLPSPREFSPDLSQIIPLVRDRLVTLANFAPLAGFFYNRPKQDTTLFTQNSQIHLEKALTVINTSDFSAPALNAGFTKTIEENQFKTGDFFMSLRIAISGTKFTPPITESIIVLGKVEASLRLEKAIQFLDSQQIKA